MIESKNKKIPKTQYPKKNIEKHCVKNNGKKNEDDSSV